MELRLERPWYGRAFGGWRLQWVLGGLLVLLLALDVVLAVAGASGFGKALRASAPGTAVIAVIWLFGATAHAGADESGVRWRYFAAHRLDWSGIEQVVLGARTVNTTGGEPVIWVLAGGRRYLVTPAAGCGRARVEFGRRLAELAQRHGVPTSITDERRWAPRG